jgi:hypothetical protein
LPTGELIIEVDGVEHRTITAAHAREIAERRVKLEFALEKITLLERLALEQSEKIALLERDRRLQEQVIALLGEQAARQGEIIAGQEKLLARADDLLKRGGRFTRWFDHPAAQLAFKLAIPVADLVLTSRK